MRRATRIMRRRRSLLIRNLDEQINALPVVQVFGRARGEFTRLSRQNDSLNRALFRDRRAARTAARHLLDGRAARGRRRARRRPVGGTPRDGDGRPGRRRADHESAARQPGAHPRPGPRLLAPLPGLAPEGARVPAQLRPRARPAGSRATAGDRGGGIEFRDVTVDGALTRVTLTAEARSARRHHRAERCGQVDPARPDRPPGRPHQGRGRHRRPAALHDDPEVDLPQDRRGRPGPAADARHGAAQPDLQPTGRRRGGTLPRDLRQRPGPPAGRAARRHHAPGWSRAGATCRSGNGRASRSAAPCSATRRSCCWTSRRRTSTRPSRRTSAGSWPGTTERCCWPPTIRRRSRWPTRSGCWTGAGSWRRSAASSTATGGGTRPRRAVPEGAVPGDPGPGGRVVTTRGPLSSRTSADGPPLSYRAFVPPRGVPAPPLVLVHGTGRGAARQFRAFLPRAISLGVPLIAPVFPADRFAGYQSLGGADGPLAAMAAFVATLDDAASHLQLPTDADRPARLLRRCPVRAPLRHAGARARAAGGRRLRRLVHLPRPGSAVPARRGAQRAERGPVGRRRGVPAHPHPRARR